MGGLAVLARQLGYQVTGSDQNVYPPMSTQLAEQGIRVMEGYKAENLAHRPDCVVIGNALSRGNPEVEAVLDAGLPYISGPQWLAEHVLAKKQVLAVAGTHGKTTTTSMLSWILQHQGLEPGFLIGGIPLNFGISARLGASDFFVIEADEYDSAFFDKRSKFVHYRPKTAILNNLEYDHADIFPDLAAIKKQFHHLVRTVPRSGCIIAPMDDGNIADVLLMGCWSERETTGLSSAADWYADKLKPDGSQFMVYHQSRLVGQVNWALTGDHNVLNALSALAAACRVGVNPELGITALSAFQNVKRRMEVIFKTNNTVIYDDFAHHPTAIATTLHGLRQQVGDEKIIAVVEPRSNTMRLGIHTETLADSLKYADLAILFQPSDLNWDVSQLKKQATNLEVYATLTDILQCLQVEARKGAHIVIMSNGGFGGIYQKLPTIVAGQ